MITNVIVDFNFAEDTVDNSIDLNNVFTDIDLVYGDELTYSFTNNVNIEVTIVDGIVTLTPESDWYGSENITFTATDDYAGTVSDEVMITVNNINDAPIINLPDIYEFAEDSEETRNYAEYINDEDPEDELTLSVSGNTEINVDITGFLVTYTASANWNGNEILTFTINDNVERVIATDTILVTVLPVNDAPEIISFSPEELEFEITEEQEIEFEVIAQDIDSDLEYVWFVNQENVNNPDSVFTFNFTENGDFEIKCVINDEEFEVETIWNVSVNITDIDDNFIIPSETKLVGSYPNPFNPEVTIEYQLSDNEKVIIEVYNIKGQKVAVLMNEWKEAGNYSLNWNAGDLNSGIYFLRFSSGAYQKMSKVVLLK